MKKLKWAILTATLAVAVTVVFFVLFNNTASDKKHLRHKLGSYYIPIEITQSTHQGIPCLSVLIENQSILLALDLGCSSDISLYKATCDQLREKEFLYSTKNIGLRGTKYDTKVFSCPKFEIENISVSQVENISVTGALLDEESEAFTRDSIIIDDDPLPPIEQGRLGWPIFQNTNLFLDLGNAKIALCDSLTTLAKNGYSVDSFVKTPIILDHNLILIKGKQNQLPFYCCLDTGCTWNILNTQKGPPKNDVPPSWSVKPPAILDSLQINQRYFYSLVWHKLPICFPFRVDAILGMNFFKTHLVFLDFPKKCAYIASRPSSNQMPLQGND